MTNSAFKYYIWPDHAVFLVRIDANKRSQSEDRLGHSQFVLLGDDLAL